MPLVNKPRNLLCRIPGIHLILFANFQLNTKQMVVIKYSAQSLSQVLLQFDSRAPQRLLFGSKIKRILLEYRPVIA